MSKGRCPAARLKIESQLALCSRRRATVTDAFFKKSVAYVLARSALNISAVRSSVMPIASLRRSTWHAGVNWHVSRNGSNSGLHFTGIHAGSAVSCLL